MYDLTSFYLGLDPKQRWLVPLILHVHHIDFTPTDKDSFANLSGQASTVTRCHFCSIGAFASPAGSFVGDSSFINFGFMEYLASQAQGTLNLVVCATTSTATSISG